MKKQDTKKTAPIMGMPDYQWNNRVVLITEDEEVNFYYLKTLLQRADATVIRAKNGKEAVEIITKHRGGIDLILMDINMPEMDGVTCAQKIFEYDPKAKIAIMSGYDSNGQYGVKEKEKKMFKGYLTKPIGLNELSQFLSRFNN